MSILQTPPVPNKRRCNMALFTFINAAGALAGLLVAVPVAIVVGIFKLVDHLAFERWWRDR